MFRLWGKILKNNRMLKDTVVCIDDSDMTRTHKIFKALGEVCETFDLPEPIWLDSNIDEFRQISKTRFSNDSFIENINFDFLEIQIIEE